MSYIRQLLIRQALRRKTNRPSGLIGQYKPYLNSNDSPTRDILKDYSGQGHDIQLYNFGYTGMSGYGGYNDFYNWRKIISGYVTASYTNYTIRVSSILKLGSFTNLSLKNITSEQKSCRFLIKGLEKDSIKLLYRYCNPENKATLATIAITKDGLFEAPVNVIPELNGTNDNYWIGFGCSDRASIKDNLDITIEQIPDYPGALVSDGVDDYGLCENFPALTIEKGFTVIGIRKWLNTNKQSVGFAIGSNSAAYNNNSAAEVMLSNNRQTVVSFTGNTVLTNTSMTDSDFFYLTSTQYNGGKITKGDNESNNGNLFIFVNKNSFLDWTSSVALYALEIYDHDLTDEEIQSVKEAMYNEYLTATNVLQNHIIADYECYDKSNEDEDRDVLKDLSGNGHDIQLHNFGFVEGSGYGLYGENYNDSHWKIRAGIIASKTSNNVTITEIKNVTYLNFYFQTNLGDVSKVVPSYKVRVLGLTDGQTIYYANRETDDAEFEKLFTIESDGIYTLPSFNFVGNGKKYGFNFGKVQESCNITIEQIPEYQGALISDGVDDYGFCENFPILNKEDGYTILSIREIISDNDSRRIFISNSLDASNIDNVGAFVFERISSSSIVTTNFGTNTNIELNKNIGISYQTSKIYNGLSINKGNILGQPYLNLFSWYYTTSPISAALYALKILNKDCTTEEIKFLAKQMVAKHKEKTGETIELNF